MKWLSLLVLGLLLAQPVQSRQAASGDINGDGLVDRADLLRGLDIALARGDAPDSGEFAAADLDADGSVTVRDLVLIARTIGGANRAPVADAGASPDSGLVGVQIHLDAGRSFDLDGDPLEFSWRQLQMGARDTFYLSTNEVALDGPTTSAPTFQPAWPGRYRFQVQVADPHGLTSVDTTDVLIRQDGARSLEAKGVVFGDVFGELGGPSFDILPDDPDSAAVVLGRAMDGAVRVGAGWVGIVPAAWYSRINPLPEIREGPNPLGLTVEADYAAIVGAAKAKGLRVVQREQLAAGILPLRPGETDSLQFLMGSSAEWWDRWFQEWKTYLEGRAVWAERHGVDMLDLFHGGDDTFRPTVYPEYGTRWREIIAAVRERFSGRITMNLFHAADLNFGDALDVVHLTIFGELYTTRGVFADVANPTIDEVQSISEEYLDAHEVELAGSVPAWYILTINSSNGQVSGDPVPPPDSELDNREQVLYYEGFLNALEDEDWVTGFFSERVTWFDQLDRPGVFNDHQLGASILNKPAEELVRLWFLAH